MPPERLDFLLILMDFTELLIPAERPAFQTHGMKDGDALRHVGTITPHVGTITPLLKIIKDIIRIFNAFDDPS